MTRGSRLATATCGLLVAVLALSGCSRLRVDPVQRFRAAVPGAHPGGRLVVGIEPPVSLDPSRISDDAGRLVSSLVCEPLVQLDPRTGRLAHGIVDAVIPAGKGAAFTLSLRKDVRFQDGSRLTAQDVSYSLSRIARHEVAAVGADVLAPVQGYDALSQPPSPADDSDPTRKLLAGVRVIGKYAVQITLTRHDAGFLRALSLPLAAPVPHRLPERDPGFSDRPVCAGPYRLVRPYHYGDRTIELRRFRGYYGADDAYVGRGQGFADTVVFELMPREQLAAALAAGTVDLAQLPGTSLPRGLAGTGEVVTAPVPEVDLLATADTTGPLADRAVRRVLSRTLDRTRLVRDVLGDRRSPADRLVPPGLAAAPRPQPCRDAVPVQAVPPTPAERALVAPLVRTGFSLTVNDDFDNLRLARAVAAQWRSALGIRVTVVSEPWEQYQSALTSPQGVPGMFRTGWSPSYPDPDAVLDPLLSSRALPTDNVARYRNRELDRLVEHDARETTDDAARARKYAEAEAIACHDLPLIPLTFGSRHYGLRTDRVGAAGDGLVDVTTGLPSLREVFVRAGGAP